jgi:hypothetical protein
MRWPVDIPEDVLRYFVDRVLTGLLPNEQSELVVAFEKNPDMVIRRLVPRVSELIIEASAYFKKSVRIADRQETARQVILEAIKQRHAR